MWKNMSDLDSTWKIKWPIMPQIAGMLKYKWEPGGFNVSDVLTDLPMI